MNKLILAIGLAFVQYHRYFLFFLVGLLLTHLSWGTECNIYQKAMERNVPDEFWVELAKIDQSNLKALAELEKKYGLTQENKSVPNPQSQKISNSSTLPPSSEMFSMHKKAIKARKSLQGFPKLQEKFDHFLDVATGGFKNIQNAFEGNKGWNLEAVPNKGPKHYTVRIDRGHRVEFIRHDDNRIEIVDIGKHVTH